MFLTHYLNYTDHKGFLFFLFQRTVTLKDIVLTNITLKKLSAICLSKLVCHMLKFFF